MQPKHWRRIWTGHRWLGVGLLLPLLWWMGTAVAFALWPIEQVRGHTLSTGRKPPVGLLKAGMAAPPELLEGARRVTLLVVEGNPIALIQRDPEPLVWDLEAGKALGSVIPLEWAVAAARRDFSGPFKVAAIYLYDREGKGRQLAPGQADAPSLPPEYGGSLPAYAFHLNSGRSLHLYVDALTGEIRARRSGVWRFYDWCFRLHSLDFTGDAVKRGIILTACAFWFALGITGSVMAWRRLRRTAR